MSEQFIFTSGGVSTMPLAFDFNTITSLAADGALYDVSTEGGVDVGLLDSSSPVSVGTENSIAQLRAYQNDQLVRLTVSGASALLTFSMLDDTQLTRELYWQSGEIDGVITVNPSNLKRLKIVLDLTSNDVDGLGTARIRRILCEGQIESTENISVAFGEPELKSVTLRIFPNGNGDALTVITKDIVASSV